MQNKWVHPKKRVERNEKYIVLKIKKSREKKHVYFDKYIVLKDRIAKKIIASSLWYNNQLWMVISGLYTKEMSAPPKKREKRNEKYIVLKIKKSWGKINMRNI